MRFESTMLALPLIGALACGEPSRNAARIQDGATPGELGRLGFLYSDCGPDCPEQRPLMPGVRAYIQLSGAVSAGLMHARSSDDSVLRAEVERDCECTVQYEDPALCAEPEWIACTSQLVVHADQPGDAVIEVLEHGQLVDRIELHVRQGASARIFSKTTRYPEQEGAPPMVLRNDTIDLRAELLTAEGLTPIAGNTLTWRTSNPDVALPSYLGQAPEIVAGTDMKVEMRISRVVITRFAAT